MKQRTPPPVQETDADRIIAAATKASARATVAMAFLTAALVVVSTLQWVSLNRQVNALEDQIKDARETARTFDRPWLVFGGIGDDTPTELLANAPLVIQWRVVNHGKLPALKTRLVSFFRKVPVGPAPKYRPEFPKGPQFRDDVGLGGDSVVGPNGHLVYSFVGPFALSPSDLTAIQSRTMALLAIGGGHYDVPGDQQRHSFGFCMWYDPADHTWSSCEGHNWAQ